MVFYGLYPNRSLIHHYTYLYSPKSSIPQTYSIKISISIDPFLDKKMSEIIVNRKFYKKSRFIEFLIKKYIDENETH